MTSTARELHGGTRDLAAAGARVSELARQAAHYRAVIDLLTDAAFTLDPDGTIREANAALAALCGASPATLAGRPLTELLAPAARAEAAQRLGRVRGGAFEAWAAEARFQGDEKTLVELAVSAVYLDERIVGMAGIARDISGQRDIEAQLVRQTLHDPLTGLANRTLFRDRVDRALARYQSRVSPHVGPTLTPASGLPAIGEQRAPAGHHVAVLFIDLDDFKTINDSLGHAEGDHLLEEVSARLLKATRGFDLVARLGGDEFGVLLEGMMREENAQPVVERITAALRRPVVLQGREVEVAASVGVAHARDARNADEMLRNAEVAMYQAKTAGKGRHAEFDHAAHAAAVARLELAADLRHATARDELFLLYQPVVELATGRIVGAESLVRWRRPGHGVVPPLAFIPVAEESGLIVPIGRWVLREACAQLARWRRTLATGPTLSMSVNVSGRQLRDAGFVDEVRAAIADAGIPAACLTLEITESVIVQRSDELLAVLHALRAEGVRLAIDDFGTGYSSLGYLQQFPIDVLKIDRTFVNSVTRGGAEAALARTIIALGDALGLEAVAEGIEQREQQEALAALGCQRGQGYLFARPLEADDFARNAS